MIVVFRLGKHFFFSVVREYFVLNICRDVRNLHESCKIVFNYLFVHCSFNVGLPKQILVNFDEMPLRNLSH